MRVVLTPPGARCHCKLTLCAGQWIKIYNNDSSQNCMRSRIRIQHRQLEALIYRCAQLLGYYVVITYEVVAGLLASLDQGMLNSAAIAICVAAVNQKFPVNPKSKPEKSARSKLALLVSANRFVFSS